MIGITLQSKFYFYLQKKSKIRGKIFKFCAFSHIPTPYWILWKWKNCVIDRVFFPENFEPIIAQIGYDLAEIWRFLCWWPPFWITAPPAYFFSHLYFYHVKKGSRNIGFFSHSNRSKIEFYRAERIFRQRRLPRPTQTAHSLPTWLFEFLANPSTIINHKIAFNIQYERNGFFGQLALDYIW